MQSSLTRPAPLFVPPVPAAPVAHDGTRADQALAMLEDAAARVLGHAEFEEIIQLSRRGGLALVRHEGELKVFKLINCQADWKKRYARRIGWNPARRAQRVSAALAEAGIPVCAVEQQGGVNLKDAPRAVWTLSRYIPNGRSLRQIKLELLPGRRDAHHVLVTRLFEDALRLLRRIHDLGFEHRDYHAGNLLVSPADEASLAAGNAQMRLVDLETVVKRRATTARRARDLRRFIENFIEQRNFRPQVERALAVYASSDGEMAAAILATRRMAGLLRKHRGDS